MKGFVRMESGERPLLSEAENRCGRCLFGWQTPCHCKVFCGIKGLCEWSRRK